METFYLYFPILVESFALLIRACVCCVSATSLMVQVAMINSTNMTFIQNFTGEQVGLAPHPSSIHPSYIFYNLPCPNRWPPTLVTLWLSPT